MSLVVSRWVNSHRDTWDGPRNHWWLCGVVCDTHPRRRLVIRLGPWVGWVGAASKAPNKTGLTSKHQILTVIDRI